jgi:hypothetical protein
MKVGRLGESFRLEVHSVTVGALNRHGTQRMPTGRFLVWMTSWWDGYQNLMIINGILDLNDFSLFSFSHTCFMFQNFLIIINLPLLLLLPLQFNHMGLMFQGFMIMIQLQMPLCRLLSHECFPILLPE